MFQVSAYAKATPISEAAKAVTATFRSEDMLWSPCYVFRD